jgi:hypothetical protein
MDKADELHNDLVLIVDYAEKHDWTAEQIIYALDYIIFEGKIELKDISKINKMDFDEY